MVARSSVDPVTSKETAHNPLLNPLLSTYVPFDSQTSVNTFFESQDRIVALQRYIRENVTWDQSSFVRRMLRLICTLEYRYEHSYPGAKITKVTIDNDSTILPRILSYHNSIQGEVYIPERLRDFLRSTAAFVADKAGYVADMALVEKQLREYFQKSNVKRELKSRHDIDKKPDARKRLYDFSASSSDEAGATPKKKQKKSPKKSAKAGNTAQKSPKKDESEDTDDKWQRKEEKKKKKYLTRAKAREESLKRKEEARKKREQELYEETSDSEPESLRAYISKLDKSLSDISF